MSRNLTTGLLGLFVVFAALAWITAEARGRFDGLSFLFAFLAAVVLIAVVLGQCYNPAYQDADSE